MNNFNDMLSKAKDMQEKMREVQDNIKKIEVEGEAGGKLVKVILSGEYEIKSITVSGRQKRKPEFINDLIVAAYNNAKENLKKKSAEELSKATGGINLPFDLKFPI